MNYKSIVAWLLGVGLLVAGGLWLLASSLPAAPSDLAEHARSQPIYRPNESISAGHLISSSTVAAASTQAIGTPTVFPSVVTVDLPTPVVVSVSISDPTVIATGVNLLRLNTNGTQTILGVMHDDGDGGDAVAGDKTFSFRATFNERTTGQIRLQVSAAFRGVLKRTLGDVPAINILQPLTLNSADIGLTMKYPADWSLHQSVHDVVFKTFGSNGRPVLEDLAYFEIRYLPNANSSSLPIDQWFVQFSKTFPSPPLSSAVQTLNGHQVIKAEISANGRYIVWYIPNGKHIIEVTYNLTAEHFNGEYEGMLKSIVVTP